MSKILVNGIEILDWTESKISDAVEERPTATFVYITDESHICREGDTVEIFDDEDNLLFGGTSKQPRCTAFGPMGAVRVAVTAINWRYLSDRRIIAKVWDDMTVGEIAKDIIDIWLADDGVTYTTESITNGPKVKDVRFNYINATKAFDALAEQANFWWRIDQHKVLWLAPYDKLSIPLELKPDGEGALPGIVDDTLVVSPQGDFYRNRQFVVGGTARTTLQSERFVGDGERRTFNVGYRVAELPTITVNSVPQTVGVRGIDDALELQWYFSFASTEISQHFNEPELESSDLIVIDYIGLVDVVFVIDDQHEIQNRQSTEGFGTGIVDDVHSDTSVNSLERGIELAVTKLAKYGRVGLKIAFDTWEEGLVPGQFFLVQIPSFGIDGEFLITSTKRTLDPDKIGPTEVEAVIGPVEGSWVRFFHNLEISNRNQILENIDEETTLVRAFDFNKDWEFEAQPNPFFEAFADGTYTAGDGIMAVFRPGQKFTHFEFTRQGQTTNPYRRKRITTKDGDTLGSSQILTSSFIGGPDTTSGEGVGDVIWYGGVEAEDDVVGSGVEIVRVTLNEPKSLSEAFQVTRNDHFGTI